MAWFALLLTSICAIALVAHPDSCRFRRDFLFAMEAPTCPHSPALASESVTEPSPHGGSIGAIAIATTGTDPWADETLEIAFVDEHGHPTFSSRFKPMGHSSWPDAERSHHISPKDVAHQPTFSSRIQEVIEALNGFDVLLAYDADFVARFMEVRGLRSTGYVSVADTWAESGQRVPMREALKEAGIAVGHGQDTVVEARLTLALWLIAQGDDTSDLVEMVANDE